MYVSPYEYKDSLPGTQGALDAYYQAIIPYLTGIFNFFSQESRDKRPARPVCLLAGGGCYLGTDGFVYLCPKVQLAVYHKKLNYSSYNYAGH
jgi:hypothetical protein